MIFDEVFFNELAILSDFLKAWSTSLMFAAGRIFGFFIIFPMFLSLKVGRSLLFGVSIALGLPLAGPLYAEYGEMIEAAGRFELVYLVHEAIVGLVVGLVFAVPFWMVAMAGVMIDVQRGATQSTGTDDALHDQKT
ncbi:MAG: flagellar biosynthetic protein FliR, partial [Pseudomonadota bacterium]